ncbi:MAG: acetylxylan esterase [Opitutaceae bacterium]|nr:acetylxylan esterase [Opitutaceae bacterium]
MKPAIKTSCKHLLALSALALGCLAGRAAQTALFDPGALAQPPAAEWGPRDGLSQQVWYAGVPFRGKPTRVYAYVARPEGKGPFPAMVLLHGGGGRAFRDWAEHWARRGYVAIAPDLSACAPKDGDTAAYDQLKKGSKATHPDSGATMDNASIYMAADTDEALRDGWVFHAATAAVRAHSLLLSLPEVDKNRTGLTGISYGGVLACIVAGVDHRFKVAAPVYGCGFLYDEEGCYFAKGNISTMTPGQRERWIRLCDPSACLPAVSCPILFVNGSNDPRFYLGSTLRSARLVRPELCNFAIIDGLKHNQAQGVRPEVDRFVDSILAGGPAVPRFGVPEITGREASVRVHGPKSGACLLHYADAGVPWKDREWKTSAATGHDALSGMLPAGKSLVYYFSLTDKNGAIATSECGVTAAAPPPKNKSPEYAPVEDIPGLPRVLLIGDSISIGYTLPVREKLKDVANIHRPPENCADTAKGLRQLDAWLGAGKWDVIHFNFGLHDIKYLDKAGKYVHPSKGFQVASPEQYEKNLRTLVRRLKDTGAALIFATTTPVPDGALARVEADAIRYNEIAAKIMTQEGVAINDLFAFASENQGEIQLKQNVHFTKQGYQLMADRVAEKIKTALAGRETR